MAANSYAQILPGHKVDGPVVIMDTLKVKAGDTIRLGQGSGSNKGFIYFFDGQHHTGRSDMANSRLVIKSIKELDDPNMGKKYLAIVNPGGIFNWAIDLESAIRSGEVSGINKVRFADGRSQVVIQNKTSAADELIKLKKLLDQGVITKEEFEKQKKKVLSE